MGGIIMLGLLLSIDTLLKGVLTFSGHDHALEKVQAGWGWRRDRGVTRKGLWHVLNI